MIVVKFGLRGGVRIEADGASVDVIYRAHLKAYGAEDAATQEALVALVNRQTFAAEASPDEFLLLADALAEAGLRKVARELYWHEAHERAEQLREEADELEERANRLEAT